MSDKPNPDNTTQLRVISLIFFKWNQDNPIKLASSFDLSNFPFFQRSIIKNKIILGSRWIASQTKPGTRQVVNFQDNLGLCCSFVTTSGLCTNVITSPTYPTRVAFGLLNEAQREFKKEYDGLWQSKIEDVPDDMMFSEQGTKLLNLYRNPSEADSILRIQNQLDDVKDIMINNIDELFKRGDKLKDLEDRTLTLTNEAKKMFEEARRANQCCKWY